MTTDGFADAMSAAMSSLLEDELEAVLDASALPAVEKELRAAVSCASLAVLRAIERVDDAHIAEERKVS